VKLRYVSMRTVATLFAVSTKETELTTTEKGSMTRQMSRGKLKTRKKRERGKLMHLNFSCRPVVVPHSTATIDTPPRYACLMQRVIAIDWTQPFGPYRWGHGDQRYISPVCKAIYLAWLLLLLVRSISRRASHGTSPAIGDEAEAEFRGAF
jgi:hypothetical protein